MWRAPTTTPAAFALRVSADGTVSYARGAHPAGPRDAVLYMTDPEMYYVDSPAQVAILDLLL